MEKVEIQEIQIQVPLKLKPHNMVSHRSQRPVILAELEWCSSSKNGRFDPILLQRPFC